MEQQQNQNHPSNKDHQTRRDERRAHVMASNRHQSKNQRQDMNRGLNQYFFGEDDDDD